MMFSECVPSSMACMSALPPKADINHRDRDVLPFCSVDNLDRNTGGALLDHHAVKSLICGVSRERVRQIEARGFEKVQKIMNRVAKSKRRHRSRCIRAYP